jgi:hypothetical protein
MTCPTIVFEEKACLTCPVQVTRFSIGHTCTSPLSRRFPSRKAAACLQATTVGATPPKDTAALSTCQTPSHVCLQTRRMHALTRAMSSSRRCDCLNACTNSCCRVHGMCTLTSSSPFWRSTFLCKKVASLQLTSRAHQNGCIHFATMGLPAQIKSSNAMAWPTEISAIQSHGHGCTLATISHPANSIPTATCTPLQRFALFENTLRAV